MLSVDYRCPCWKKFVKSIFENKIDFKLLWHVKLIILLLRVKCVPKSLKHAVDILVERNLSNTFSKIKWTSMSCQSNHVVLLDFRLPKGPFPISTREFDVSKVLPGSTTDSLNLNLWTSWFKKRRKPFVLWGTSVCPCAVNQFSGNLINKKMVFQYYMYISIYVHILAAIFDRGHMCRSDPRSWFVVIHSSYCLTFWSDAANI